MRKTQSIARALLVFGLSGVTVPAFAGSPGCTGDVVPNGAVNVDDLLAVINRWGQSTVQHTVTVNNAFVYSPSTVNAKSGDSVRWVREAGAHTTTSGSNCTADGRFNSVLNATVTSFTYPIPNDFTGPIPFFCMPHCPFGMTGVINVAPFHEDVTGNGTVNVDDLLAVINGWGPCL